ncbi:MAG: cystathionine beta-lyase [Alphaproteobacteria bacterium]|nr:cystathionine beta-lyase [Alphaproteobacteria bacterium]
MNSDTELATLGLAPEEYEGVVNMPVARASTILFRNLEDFEAGERGEYKLPIYGRYGNPTQGAFESAIAALEGVEHAIALGSGMAAIAAAVSAFVAAGDHILVTDSVYGPMRRYCDQMLSRFGVETTYYNPEIGGGIASLLKQNTKVVYCESPGSLTFEMQDIPAIVKAAHTKGAIVIADNTWATPLYFNAFAHGVDVSMHSATKYIGGHSDLLMGTLACRPAHYKRLLYAARNFGATPAADNCYLALRGLRTMALRLRQHQASAMKIAAWLAARPEVEEVYYPALPGSRGHALWKRDMTGACGLFSVLLKPVAHEKLRAFIDGLKYFGLGYSWGGFESLLIPCNLEKVRAVQLPKEGTLVRLHIGLEDPEDLMKDLEAGFARLKP